MSKRKLYTQLSKSQKRRRLLEENFSREQIENDEFSEEGECDSTASSEHNYSNNELPSNSNSESSVFQSADQTCSSGFTCTDFDSNKDSDLRFIVHSTDSEFHSVHSEFCDCSSYDSTSDMLSVDELQNNNAVYHALADSANLQECLYFWARNEKKVANEAIDRLLKILKTQGGYKLPATARGLLNYKPIQLQKMETGEYFHFQDWIQSCSNFLEANLDNDINRVNAIINIDGIPLYNNTRKYEAYPILLKIKECSRKVITVGIFCTNDHSKSLPNIDILLKQFIEDVKNMNGKIITNSKEYEFSVSAFSCDAPMRAYIKGIVAHTGYSSCERCTQVGEFHNEARHIVFTGVLSGKRTNESFFNRQDLSHHKIKEPTLLETELHFNMVSGFCLDYMHLCCLGVMKRIFNRLLIGKAREI